MKRLIAGALAVSMAFVSANSFAQQNQSAAEIQTQLEEQRSELEEFQAELQTKTKERSQMVALTVGLSMLTVLASIPGVTMSFDRAKNLKMGTTLFKRPHTPSMGEHIAVVGAPLVLGATATSTFLELRIHSSDVKLLNKKIEAKLAQIQQAEQLLRSVQR